MSILLIRKLRNILEVELISTEKLDKAEIEKIKASIGKQNFGKTIEIKETLKKEILGGLQIKIGSNLIDASLKNQISNIGKELIRAAQ